MSQSVSVWGSGDFTRVFPYEVRPVGGDMPRSGDVARQGEPQVKRKFGRGERECRESL